MKWNVIIMFLSMCYSSILLVSFLVAVPADLEQLVKNIDNSISLTESISSFKPMVTVPVHANDREDDGTFLSSRSAIKRIIDFEHHKPLQSDTNGNSIFKLLQRAFQRKGGNKIARVAGLSYSISYGIKICYECINVVRFGDGLLLKEYIDNQRYNMLFLFKDAAKNIINVKWLKHQNMVMSNVHLL